MGLFDKLFSFNQGVNENNSEQIIDDMLANAEICLEQQRPENAFSTYHSIVEMTDNVTAQYNLGVLYATGQGIEQNFLQASYWFHQAYLNGDINAEKLQIKSMLDYIYQNINKNSPGDIYQEMLKYAEYLYPGKNSRDIAVENISALASHHYNKHEYEVAAKLFHAAAEFGNDGNSQNYLAVLYNAGAGVEKNDLAALYWFDRATDNHVEAAKIDRDGIFSSYRNNLSTEDFLEQMEILALFCTKGTEDIPRDTEKADYWRKQK